MADEPQPSAKPQFTAEAIREKFKTMASWVEIATGFAQELDWLGDAKDHPEGSEERELAKVRDDVDLALSNLLVKFMSNVRHRAEKTRSVDLLAFAEIYTQGDGYEALHLIRRYQEVSGDDTKTGVDPGPETFPDSFAWDTYLRVSALAGLAEEFPMHLRHSARQMHGWPMIVSHHLDGRAEFERVAERLELGADFPLNVGPRKKRGTETPLLRYLEPKVWRLHVLRERMIEWGEIRKPGDFVQRIYGFWWEFPDPEPEPEVVPILQRLPSLPPLTQKTAREWSRKVIVPLIMLEDAETAETCETPALQNIWRHRSVKSRSTFQSRLHSAVTDTLERFGRAD